MTNSRVLDEFDERFGLGKNIHYDRLRAKAYFLSALSQQREEIVKMVEGMKKNLVVNNWEDAAASHCNPRCHDSGKDTVLTDILTQLKTLEGGLSE